ncbi:MAG: aspartyl protease family protein [Opitutaceae bacterium]
MRRFALAAGWAALLVALGGCVTLRHAPPPPGSAKFGSKKVVLPVTLIDDFLIVRTKGDQNGPFHFLVDTGSSVTLVAPGFARRYGAPERGVPATWVQVRSSDGRQTLLPAVTLTRIELGAARFSSVPAVVYDMRTLSADLGVRIDAILGFPFFHDTEFTLDYPDRKLVLRPAAAAVEPAAPGIPYDDADKTPIVTVQLDGRSFPARIDSGIDEALTLNPAGLNPRFEYGPVVGRAPYTVAGSGVQHIGRLAGSLSLAGHPVARPVAELTSGVSAIGGGLLADFSVTFDPRDRRVSFFRDDPEPIAIPGPRTPGLSFDKTPAYWRVVGVVPGSPAAAAGVEAGDLVTRIEGRPVGRWDLERYDALVANAERISFTFLEGTREVRKSLRVVALVP